MIKLTILGSGAAVPTPERNLPSIAVKERRVYLMDCGEGTQRQMMKYKVSYSKVKCIFISHLHLDHYLGVFGLLNTLKLHGRTEPLYIFGPKGIKELIGKYPFAFVEEIDKNFEYIDEFFSVRAFENSHTKNSFGFVLEELPKRKFNERKAKSLGIKGKLFREIQEKGKVKIGKKTIKLDDVSKIAKGKKISYSGDTKYDENIVKHSKNSDILIHEATFDDSLKEEAELKKHSTASDAAKAAKKSKAKKLILTHIGGRYDDASVLEKQARKTFKKTYAAFDGLSFDL